MRQHVSLLRSQALGPFKPLLQSICHDPATLLGLDCDANRKSRPNENSARGLLATFTLGPGNFTELDVREAARALTGGKALWPVLFVVGLGLGGWLGNGFQAATAPAAMTGDLVQAAKQADADLSSLLTVGGGGAPRAPEQVKDIGESFVHLEVDCP